MYLSCQIPLSPPEHHPRLQHSSTQSTKCSAAMLPAVLCHAKAAYMPMMPDRVRLLSIRLISAPAPVPPAPTNRPIVQLACAAYTHAHSAQIGTAASQRFVAQSRGHKASWQNQKPLSYSGV